MSYYRVNLKPPIYNHLNDINRFMLNRGQNDILLNFDNTIGLTIQEVNNLKRLYPSHLYIRIAGGYDDDRIRKDSRDYLKYDNIYTLDEMAKILVEIQKIEEGLKPSFTPEQKLFYFIGYLRNKIIYHPNFETQPSKDIRSLTGLFSHMTVCAGYALILKELCDRNGIQCDYVTGFARFDESGVDKSSAHAWNLVHLNGKIIPLDLTWNAAKNKRGQFFDISDLANVNAFINHHKPNSYEAIQDYSKALSSLDGDFIRSTYNMVNKNMIYDVTKEYFTRRDGSKFMISLVEVENVDTTPVYKYVYTAVKKDGSLDIPIIVKSTTNVSLISSCITQRDKAVEKLRVARAKNDVKTIQELEKSIKDTEFYKDFKHYIADVLFSINNMTAAVMRRDLFIGGIVPIKGKDDKTIGIKGVEVDPNLGSKIKNEYQRLYSRSDGSKFVMESRPKIRDESGNSIYRYVIYETTLNEKGYPVTKKNTIFSDEDLFLDKRQSLADDFLSRSRIDRKEREAAGYVGTFGKDGIHYYTPDRVRYFTSGMYKKYALTSANIREYIPSLTFADVKRLVSTYTTDEYGIIVNKYTNAPLTNKKMLTQFKFATLWLRSAGVKYNPNDTLVGGSYAFNSAAEELFKTITDAIETSINRFGYIDSVSILKNIQKNSTYKYAAKIIIHLFSTPQNCDIINEFYRMQNPGALTNRDKKIQHFGVGGWGETTAYNMLSERAAQEEKIEKGKIDVEYQNGVVTLRGRR